MGPPARRVHVGKLGPVGGPEALAGPPTRQYAERERAVWPESECADSAYFKIWDSTPPSTATSVPVMKPAASLSRNRTSWATSSGWP